MKCISILTATRAEYGLLRPLIRKLNNIPEFDVKVVVTGAHLSPEFGLTYHEIENDGIIIHEKIEILLSSDTPASITKSMGLAMISFADYFVRIRPDILIVLGDRYETLAVCCAAMNMRIPIAHLYGGETTEGAVDESIRHAITKMSYLHFTSTNKYRDRVIQLGEHPDRVFNVGAMGVENIKNEKLLTKKELELSLNFELNSPYAVVTFHPVTLEENNSSHQFSELLRVCSEHTEMKFIFTKANADSTGRIINVMIDEYVKKHKHAIAFASLGLVRYLSSLKYANIVIGNSSSGLSEAPSFGIPTINVGDRQKGRIQAESVINCEPVFTEINSAINLAMTKGFIEKARKANNPYGNGDSSDRIVETLKNYLMHNQIDIKKKFYDLEA